MEKTKLTLPWPILASSNSRNTRLGGRGHGWEYKRSLKLVHEFARFSLPGRRKFPVIPEGPVAMTLVFFPPDRRRRDVHNYLKGLLDALQGVIYADDYQIQSLSIYREEPDDDPRCEIVFWVLDP